MSLFSEQKASSDDHADNGKRTTPATVFVAVVWGLAVVGVTLVPELILLAGTFIAGSKSEADAAMAAALWVSIVSYVVIAGVSLSQWARGRRFISGGILLVLSLLPIAFFSVVS